MTDSQLKVKLVIHIGAGKTGTTSIQHTLRDNKELLQQQGVWYFGMTGERAPLIKLYPWQTAMGFHSLMNMEEQQIEYEFADLLIRNLKEVQSRGGRLAILSNEALDGYARYNRIRPILSAIERVRSDGWPVEVIGYVRRPDSWIKSAYIQWGIKHKSYPGPLCTFSEWVATFPYKFGPSLKMWADLQDVHVHIRNFDKAGDVVQDFLKVCGVSLEVVRFSLNEYAQPASEELLLRALLNRIENGDALPDEFDELFQPDLGDFRISAQTYLEELLPTEKDLSEHLASCAEDIEFVNSLIVSDGGEPLDTSHRPYRKENVDTGKLEVALFYLLAAQAKKVRLLERQLAELSQRIQVNHDSPQSE